MKLFCICLFVLCFLSAVSLNANDASSPPAKPMIQDGHTDRIDAVTLRSEGSFMATSINEGTKERFQVWYLSTGRPAGSILRSGPELYHWPAKLFLTADCRTLVTGGRFGEAILWNTTTGTEEHKFDGHDQQILPITMSQSGLLFVFSGKSYVIWNTNTGKVNHKVEPAERFESITCASFSADSRLLAIGLAVKKSILWDLTTQKEIRTFKGHKNIVNSVALNADGKILATGSEDKTVIVWDTTTGKQLRKIEGHTDAITDVVLNNNGKILVTASKDGTVKLWSVTSGQELRRFEGHTRSSPGIVLSNDGRQLVAGTKQGTLKIWDVQSGNELCQMMSFDKGKEWLVITPDGLFDGSPGAMNYVSYRQPKTNKLISLKNYQDKYYTAGLLPLVLKGKAPKVKFPANQFVPEG